MISGRVTFALLVCLSLCPGPASSLKAQALEESGLVATGLLMRQMDGVKRVLMIGAHPDDEDTSLLAALARGQGAETAYLSLTRGEGGQNLIGPELWEGLGVIRTGELEAARRLDGGRQFFTRALDYGYSKTADEALTFWPREELLHDVVWIIRKFRPHVVVAVFSGTPRDGHGQHQASGIIAREAYEVAGDAGRFPEQLERGVEPWTPLKLFHLARRDPESATATVPAGDFDPLLGRSELQLSMESRSFHRSQDMGAPQPMGPRTAGVRLERSRVEEVDDAGIFAGIDTTLVGATAGMPEPAAGRTRAHLEAYRASLEAARSTFGGIDAFAVAAPLKEALGHLLRAREAAGDAAGHELATALARKIELARRAVLAASGVVLDVRADDDLVTLGQTVRVSAHAWNGGPWPLSAADAALSAPEDWSVARVSAEGLAPNGSLRARSMATWVFDVTVPAGADRSELYFLREEREGAWYTWPDEPELWGLPRDPAPVGGVFDLDFGDVRVRRNEAWAYVGVDPARGEFRRPVLVVPAVSVHVAPDALVWPEARAEPRTLTVSVRAEADGGSRGYLVLSRPEGWRVSPSSYEVSLESAGAERSFVFEVRPTGQALPGEHVFRATLTDERGSFVEGYAVIDYEHIEPAALYAPAEASVSVVSVRVADGLRVGYVMGTGDAGPEVIRQLGAQVTLLGPDRVRAGDFAGFDALVLGVRAYEAREDVRAANAQILDFARAGGTVVVQYNQYEWSNGDYAPYPVRIGRPADRVAEEDADVTILEPEAPVFTTPNRITEDDFRGWVQERGLYFVSEWDEAYVPLLDMHDAGEDPKQGSLLIAPLGQGLYVYAALSFFRQWSSGAPGPYRLFANLISLSPEEWRRYRAERAGGPGERR
ncbi:MAG TPA: PIG-L family deacetylase [Longimicrobiales bacterium]|nr:PIG-L family deacetylase [Longimicrobiales bacterium]